MSRGGLQNTILPTAKRQYRPAGRTPRRPNRPQDRLQYHSGRGIEWAYRVIEAHERDRLHFAKMSDEQFAWALAKARAADYGHERDYVVPADGRWFHENREELLQRARENVRDWAYTWKQQQQA